MALAPLEVSEAKVQIPERAAHGDRANVHAVRQQRRPRGKVGQRGLGLVQLCRAPLGPAQRFGTCHVFVARQQGRVQDADLDESAHVNRPGYVLHGGIMRERNDVGASLHFHTPEIWHCPRAHRGCACCRSMQPASTAASAITTTRGSPTAEERLRISANLGNGIALVLRHTVR